MAAIRGNDRNRGFVRSNIRKRSRSPQPPAGIFEKFAIEIRPGPERALSFARFFLSLSLSLYHSALVVASNACEREIRTLRHWLLEFFKDLSAPCIEGFNRIRRVERGAQWAEEDAKEGQ